MNAGLRWTASPAPPPLFPSSLRQRIGSPVKDTLAHSGGLSQAPCNTLLSPSHFYLGSHTDCPTALWRRCYCFPASRPPQLLPPLHSSSPLAYRGKPGRGEGKTNRGQA